MNRQRARLWLVLIIVAGAILRLHGLRWDQGHHLHPDERFISMVEEKLAFPRGPAEYFDSARSPLNPYNKGFGSFVYGTLPMVLARAAGKLSGSSGYDGTYLVGRALSTAFDLLTILLVYRIARRFAGRRTALLAAALFASSAFAIQLSHFWTVDTFLTTFTAGVLLGSVRMAQRRAGWVEDAAIGICIGLAAACKITALALFLPVGVGILVRDLPSLKPGARSRGIWLLSAALRLLVVIAATAAAVRVAFPTAFAGPSPFSFRLDPRWVNDLKGLANLSRTVAGFPPSLQWAGRSLWFPIRNFILQGVGLVFGIAALASLAWALIVSWTSRRLALLPLALHTLFVFLYHGLSMVKTMRYFYPAYPAMAVLAALGTAELARRAAEQPGKRWLRFAPALVLAGTVVWALAFSAIYSRPHTRVEASRWIYDHVAPGSRIANESWDDGLPFPLPGHDNMQYTGPMLELWGPDNREKVEQILKTLGGSDWIAVTSGRVYRNITRLPSVYPMTTAYYRALFDGRLGFDLAADFVSYPSLGALRIPDDGAEEQFTVYDHPRVLLFRKSPAYSEERARKLLLAALPRTPPTIWDWEKLPRSQRSVSPPVEPPRGASTRVEDTPTGPEIVSSPPAPTVATGQAAEALEPEGSPVLSDTPAPGRPPFSGLKEPRDAAVDGQGRLWVADFGHSRLRLYDADGGYLGGWGGRGDGDYQLRELCGVAIRGNDLYVADTWNGRVLGFTLAGAWKAVAHDLYGPRGVAASPDGSIWVADTGNHRLVVYDTHLSGPRVVGSKGPQPGQFDSPVGIAAGPDGAIYVCDTGNRRIQVLSPDGAFRRAAPVEDWKSTDEPHVEVDDDGTLYATEPSGNGLLELAPDGHIVRRYDRDDSGRPFSQPTGVALDRKRRVLYVVNSGNSSIARLKLPDGKGP